MPTNPWTIFSQLVGNIVSGFFSSGLVVLSVIGPALLGVVALFVLFYFVAMSFGWRLKMPVRPGRKQGVLGNPKHVHFEKGTPFSFRDAFNSVYSKFWMLQTPVSPTAKFFLRPTILGGGLSEGHPSFGGGDFVDGFGSDFMPVGDDDEWGGDWLDREDDRDGFYADPSYYASYTSDSGPDSSPGRQEGGLSPYRSVNDVNAHDGVFSFADNVDRCIDSHERILSGGLSYGHSFSSSGDISPVYLMSNLFIKNSDEGFDWEFLHGVTESCSYSTADEVLRGLEAEWLKAFGAPIVLAPGEHSAYSAETAFHAARILELHRLRSLEDSQGPADTSLYNADGYDLSGDEDLSAYDR